MLPTSHQCCPTCHLPTDRLIVVHGLVVALDCWECLLVSTEVYKQSVCRNSAGQRPAPDKHE